MAWWSDTFALLTKDLSALISLMASRDAIFRYTDGACLETFLQGGHDVGREIPGIRARVGQDFMVFVQALHDVQGLFGGISVPLVRLPLKRGQVVKRWRERFFDFLLISVMCRFFPRAAFRTASIRSLSKVRFEPDFASFR